jgi:heme-degrading monooxygenase HmoA
MKTPEAVNLQTGSEKPEETGLTGPVTTLTIFHFRGRQRLWAFMQMGQARPLLKKLPGLRFYKLLGSGRVKVFSLRPDWSRYAFLGVWESEQAARDFLENSAFMRRYRAKADCPASVILRTISAHGKWNGQNPFLPAGATYTAGPVAALTRATIRPVRLAAFWRQAGRVNESFDGAAGLLSSIGIGEAPFIRQATFSTWESLDDLKQFAYGEKVHRQTIQRVRQEGWYSEELFARFAIVEISRPFP